MYYSEHSLHLETIRNSDMMQRGNNSFLNCSVHVLCNPILLRTNGAAYRRNAVLSTECDEFIRYIFFITIKLATFQFSVSLIPTIGSHFEKILNTRSFVLAK